MVLWLTFARSWQMFIIALGTALVATGVEIFLVTREHFFIASIISVYLVLQPALYFATAIAAGNIGRRLKKKTICKSL